MRRGSQSLKKAIDAGWIIITPDSVISDPDQKAELFSVDKGEAEAIALAKKVEARLLIMDDKKGRSVAKKLGLKIIGTAGILLRCKKTRHLELVVPVLDALLKNNYRFSNELCMKIAREAEEKWSF